MSDSIIRLQSATVDVVIKARPFAEIIYWGPHLSHFSPQDADSLTRPVANGRLDVDSPVTLMAELGHGLFGAPGIEGHRRRGWMPRRFSPPAKCGTRARR